MITNLRLQHFRTYKDDSFEFGSSVNIIVGPNASGKSNLLEALQFLAHGRSYRAGDAELIEFGETWARLDAYTNGATRTVKLTNQPKLKKEYIIGQRLIKKLTADDIQPYVLFEPNDLNILTGQPDSRRNFLDDLLVKTESGYKQQINTYQRCLFQRNRLLKSQNFRADELFPWDIRLSQLAGVISQKRHHLVALIDETLPALYRNISNSDDEVRLKYRPSFALANYESAMLRYLSDNYQIERQRGFTLQGPHREDFTVKINNHNINDISSRGETRTTALCMKIAELNMLQEIKQPAPFLLLDDVFSELDGSRRHALTDHLSANQVFITTTDADIVVQHFINTCTIIPVTH